MVRHDVEGGHGGLAGLAYVQELLQVAYYLRVVSGEPLKLWGEVKKLCGVLVAPVLVVHRDAVQGGEKLLPAPADPLLQAKLHHGPLQGGVVEPLVSLTELR